MRPGTRADGHGGRAGHVRRVAGIVLAGGRSSRFGSDKLAATLEGRPLLEHAIVVVAGLVDEVIVVVAPGAEIALPAAGDVPVRVVHDPEPYGGPLIGLATALDATDAHTSLVVGADMPRLAPAVLLALVAASRRPPGAVALAVEGRDQPLPAAYDTIAARAAAATCLARGDRSLRALLAAMAAVRIPAASWRRLDPSGATILDIDRPEDLAATEGLAGEARAANDPGPSS